MLATIAPRERRLHRRPPHRSADLYSLYSQYRTHAMSTALIRVPVERTTEVKATVDLP